MFCKSGPRYTWIKEPLNGCGKQMPRRRSKQTKRHTPAPVNTKIFCDRPRSHSTWSRCVMSSKRLRRGGSDSRLSIIFHSVRLSSSSGRSVSCGTRARSTARGSAPSDIWRYTQTIGPTTDNKVILQHCSGKVISIFFRHNNNSHYMALCSRRYQKKHSPMQIHPDHQPSFSNFFNLLRSIESSFSICVLGSPFPQSLFRSYLVYLLVWGRLIQYFHVLYIL